MTTEPLFVRIERERPESLKAYRNAPADLRDEAEAYMATKKPGVRTELRAELGRMLREGGREAFAEHLRSVREFHAMIEAKRPEWERERIEREAALAQEKERRREAYRARLAEARAAIERGEPVPAHLRPVGGRCFFCHRDLRDEESVRLGVGPECRKFRGLPK